jgi:hypothetical protein
MSNFIDYPINFSCENKGEKNYSKRIILFVK